MTHRLPAFTALLLTGALSGCSSATSSEPTIGVAFAGDILLDSAPGKAVARGEDPFAKTESLFRGASVMLDPFRWGPVPSSGVLAIR